MKIGIITGTILLLSANYLFAQTSYLQTKKAGLGFIENKGQIIDQDNNPNPEVLYLLNTPGFNVQLRRGGWSYDVYTPKSPKGDLSSLLPGQERDSVFNFQLSTFNFHRIEFDLIGSNPNCEIITSEPSSDYLNYYTAGTPVEGVTFVRSYQQVTYKNIYPEIDLECLIDPEQGYKYNWIIHPGGKLSSVKVKISSPGVTVTTEGSLELVTTITKIEEKIPNSFVVLHDTKSPVDIDFHEISPGIYGFICNRTFPMQATLVIDPIPDRVWGTYYGGSGYELFGGMQVSPEGNIYICGATVSASNIATSGAHQVVYMGQVDAFLTKFNKEGEIQWGTYYGGTQQDLGRSCALGSSQEVYLCGETRSVTNIATPGSFQPVIDSLNDAFLAKFSTDGIRVWGTYYGGNNNEAGRDCCVDTEGNIYLVGETFSTTGIASPGAYQEINNGYLDVFIVRFTGDGERSWGTYYGGEAWENGLACTTDSIGSLFIAGNTNSHTSITSPDAHQSVPGGGIDGLLARFTQDGQRVWGTYYGGEADDDIHDCTATLWGDVFIAGITKSIVNISSPGSFQPVMSGPNDCLIAKFVKEGTRIWGTYYGGTGGEYLNTCAIDDSVNLYVAGPTSSNGLGTPGVYQQTPANISEAGIVAKFDSAGQREWATYYSGLGADHAWCDVDTSWNIYICGETASTTMFSTPGSYQPVFGGGTMDCYLSRFVQCLPPDTAGMISGPDTVCKSATSVAFSVDHITNASHYSWTVPPGAVITAGIDTDSIEVWFGPASGSGNLSVYGYNYCGTGVSSNLYITVQDAPILNLDGPDTVCLNSQASYSTTIGMVEYFWNVSSGGTIISGGTASDDTAIVYWNMAGPQWIEVDATDISGCSAYDPPMMDVFVGDTDTVEVTIVAQTDTVCSGDQVTITATPAHGGMNPVFQWLVNGISTGTNSPVFTYVPNDADQVSCTITSSDPCVTNNPDTSNTIILTVLLNLPVGISIIPDENPVCDGTTVSFTANTMNGGLSPVFQWHVNGVNAGTNNAVFTYAPGNGDVVTCTLTSSETCTTTNPSTSNVVTMEVHPFLSVSVSIYPSVNPVCEEESVTFTASDINGGMSPSYQWYLNNFLVGNSDSIYTFIPLLGDQVYCILTSSEQCTSNNPATSDTVTMIVNPLLPVGISISASINPVCEGLPVTFTGAAINGGSTPIYQWQVNGINTGTNNSDFTYTPVDGDLVTCTLASNAICVTNNPTTSNSITMSVGEAPDVSFAVCFDTITTLNAKPFKLKGGIPLGGTYSGPGVDQITGYFNPALAGIGLKTIYYSYTNQYTCSDNATRAISVINPIPFSCGDSLTDIRDNKKYPTIQIGSQCWLAVNLNHGQQIGGSSAQRDNCIVEKYCYNDLPANCTQYGALYQWDELMRYEDAEEIQGLCPPGWHVPSETDWNQLFTVYQGNAFAGSPLLYTGYSGFNVLLAGVEFFNQSNRFADFASIMWSSTSHGPYKAWSHGLNEYNYSVSYYPSYRANAFSVRCIRE